MSIINEALKKAQVNLDEKNKSIPTVGPVPIPESELRPKFTPAPDPLTLQKSLNEKTRSNHQRSSHRPRFVLPAIVTCIVLLLITGLLIFLNNQKQPNEVKVASPAKASINKFAAPITSAPAPMASPAPALNQDSPLRIEMAKKLIVKGILTQGEKKAALINNNIYQVGDVIERWEIHDIKIDRVEFINGKDIIAIKVLNH